MHLDVSQTVAGHFHEDGNQWFALRTRSRHEKKVAAEIAAKGISAFLPMTTQKNRWSDRYKIVELPLFPCYVFVRTDSSPESRVSVLRTFGAVNFIGNGGRGQRVGGIKRRQIGGSFGAMGGLHRHQLDFLRGYRGDGGNGR